MHAQGSGIEGQWSVLSEAMLEGRQRMNGRDDGRSEGDEAHIAALAELARSYGLELVPVRGSAPGRQEARLTPRQIEVLRALKRHSGTKQAAAALGVRPATVNRQVGYILKRLGVQSRMEAVCWACARGLLDD